MLAVCLIVVAVFALLWFRHKKRKADSAPLPDVVVEKILEEPKPAPPKPIEQRKIIITPHSIDRASTRHHEVYLSYREHQEDGLYSWLMREVKSLRLSGQLRDGENNIDHTRVLWAIIVTDDVVVLKSLSFKKGKHRRKKPLSNNQIEKLKRRKGNARSRANRTEI